MIFDCFLVLYIISVIPRLLWKKKRFLSLKEYFGVSPPNACEGDQRIRIWLHAVSVGEVKAAQSLVALLAKREQGIHLLVTTTTLAGREEAHRCLPEAEEIRQHPLDFSWIMRRWIRSFRPHQLIFVEGNLWPNLLREAKRTGVRTALVSGKISQKSLRRFALLRFLCRPLFDRLDLISVQNKEQHARFSRLTCRPIHVTGNLKLDIRAEKVDGDAVRKRFRLSSHPVITVSCTHAPEEKELLDALDCLWDEFPNLVLFLAPRHPERVQEVTLLLSKMQLSYTCWADPRNNERIVLVDLMGQLANCYSVSRIAVVGGSFSSRIGGHNVLEPCLYGCPVLFGPHMFAQEEFAQMAIEEGSGKKVSSQELRVVLSRELLNPTLSCRFPERCGSAKRVEELLVS
jgi:3-deoxy-D-manno-octulosonic-acid transferase